MSREETARSADGETLIFLHIPKTAGTTLNRIIESQYNPFAIYTIDPYGIRATVERLRKLPEARRRRFRVVRGHLSYGVHQFLPQGATYITMLRDPVARVLSAYHFVLRRPLNPLHWKLKRERLSLEDCLRVFPDRRNLQCRMIAGVANTAIDGERLLEIAKENLIRSFSVVGICERFDESLILISQKFGWTISLYENQRVSTSRPMVEPELVELIRQHNRLDDELYGFGKQLLEEALRKNAAIVEEGLTELRGGPHPGKLRRCSRSTLSAGRFLLNKIASAM